MLENKAVTPTIFQLDQNPMLESPELHQDQIMGVDLFIESNEQPNVVAEKCLKHCGSLFTLVTISNRGTQVWPRGSVFTNLINQYRARFEASSEVSQNDLFALMEKIGQDFKICSSETLNAWDGKKAYSLAQGQ